jgi:hypothetical protein
MYTNKSESRPLQVIQSSQCQLIEIIALVWSFSYEKIENFEKLDGSDEMKSSSPNYGGCPQPSHVPGAP